MNRYRVQYTEIKPGGHHDRQDEAVHGARSDVVRYLAGRTVLRGSVRVFENVGPMNPRIAALSQDQRAGLPVPWSSAVLANGRPDFTTVAHDRALRAAQERLCGVCGQPLQYWIAFLGTPRCWELGTFFDPPMHPDCARDSLTLCPHIAGGHPVTSLASGSRREVDGWLLWITRQYQFGVVDGRVAFAPAPHKRLEHYLYQPDGTLALAVVDGVAAPMFPAHP